MMNTDYDKEYVFDIDAYLVASYPKMNMQTRRSICALAINEWLDDTVCQETVDEVVGDYAKNKLELNKLEDDEEDEDCVGG